MCSQNVLHNTWHILRELDIYLHTYRYIATSISQLVEQDGPWTAIPESPFIALTGPAEDCSVAYANISATGWSVCRYFAGKPVSLTAVRTPGHHALQKGQGPVTREWTVGFGTMGTGWHSLAPVHVGHFGGLSTWAGSQLTRGAPHMHAAVEASGSLGDKEGSKFQTQPGRLETECRLYTSMFPKSCPGWILTGI